MRNADTIMCGSCSALRKVARHLDQLLTFCPGGRMLVASIECSTRASSLSDRRLYSVRQKHASRHGTKLSVECAGPTACSSKFSHSIAGSHLFFCHCLSLHHSLSNRVHIGHLEGGVLGTSELVVRQLTQS